MDPTSSFAEGFANLSVGDLPVNPPHEPIVRDADPLLARVSNERDRFIDDDHKPLNAELLKTFSLYRELNKEPALPALLSNITVEDERLVTLSPSEAKDLLKREPSINPLLHKAWKEGSFKEVRKLEILWPVVQAPRAKWHHLLPIEDSKLKRALQSAWHDDYLGDHHRLLFSHINAIPPTGEPYSNQITIVQSSGTGKSRMVHEQAKLVFTIPFNLRGEGSTQNLAFPIPDTDVRNWLVRTAVSDNLNANYLKFLASVFTQVNDELEKRREELSKKQIKSAEDLAKWWSRHFEGVREGLYKAAITDAKQPSKNLPEIQKRHEELLAEGEGYYEDPLVVIEIAAAESARLALEQLISKLNGWDGPQPIKLIIYFDEAHSLSNVMLKDGERTLDNFLCTCLNQFLSFPVFFIFLSTNSNLTYFAAPQALPASARIRGGPAIMHAPITETPFDCCGDLMVKPGELRIKDISTIPFMAKFGRPLFWTVLRGARMNARALHTEVLELARAKLVLHGKIDAGYDYFSRTSKLAVLDVQLSLDFEPRLEKVHIEEASLVLSHMRFAYSIPGHREYLRSGYPSEPLLAEAAAQQLWNWRMKRPFVVVETLTDVLNDGWLDCGELGELTGRQLLLDAYHRAVEQEQPDHLKGRPPLFSAGCRLITFIGKLYSKKCAKMVLDSTPDNMEGVSFREAFKDALVCFTHFGKMADDTGVTSSAAWAAFIRHMAIICRNGHRTVDCIIPVLLWDTGLCEHVMTGVLVQFKRQIESGGTIAIDQTEINFFPKTLEKCTHGSTISTSYNYRPYISLVMELGVQGGVPEEAKTTTKFKHHPKEGHPRYNIIASGCSPTVYGGIDAAHKYLYAQLLSSRDFLGEHPRQDAQTLKAARRMKPFWNGGEDCYHWVEHDDILHGTAPPRREEFLVGKQM